MKNYRTSLTFIITLLVVSGCYKDPEASFTMSASTVEIDEDVTFTNTSLDMDHCEWLFGDGEGSTEISPTHSYAEARNYEVTLRVFSKKDMKADKISNSISVIHPTYLYINVYDLESSDPLDDAGVELYTTEDDFYAGTNILAEGNTNSLGFVSFKDVPAGKIYISIFKFAYESGDYTYFYSNWFVTLNGNTYNTQIVSNEINELDIYARLGYLPSSGRLAKNTGQ